MDNCQEISCVNVQSAVCLHCLHRLRVTHIVAHGNFLSKEGDQLCEEINELAEQLNVCLQQIHTARGEATDKLNIWRQNQIDRIEQKFAEKIQVMKFRKDHLTDLENRLTERLTIEAKQPLEDIQSRQNASSQSLQTIRQAIATIVRDTIQLELCSQDSSGQSTSSSSVRKATVVDKSHLLQSNSTSRQYPNNQKRDFINSVINPSDLQTIMTTQSPLCRITSPGATSALSNQVTTMQTIGNPLSTKPKPAAIGTASASATIPQPQVVVSARAGTMIKRPPTYSCKKLIKYFENVSGSSDGIIEHYIVRDLHQAFHVNNMMILLLSLLEAWHSPKLPTVFNQNVLLHHINIVKKYIKRPDHQLTVLAAIQVFLNSCNYHENKSSELIPVLFQFFFNHQCITQETVLDWYKNGAYYGYAGFDKAKSSAKLFIDQLNPHLKSK